jgi:cellulose synthase/poly-beta-1,6-N-acetylglucosamine synthase-like glycosyltransferase
MIYKYSVIITAYEDSYYLRKCIDELLNLNYLKFEIILISEVLIDFDLYLKKHKNFTVLCCKNVKSPAKKRNIASKKAQGEILAFLDDDSYPKKNWLKIADKFFLNNSQKTTCVGGPGILPKNESFFGKICNLYFISRIFYPFSERYTERKEKNLLEFSDWPSVNFFIRKSFFFKIRGFDERYWPGEDSKLCEEVLKRKGKIIYISNLIVFHYRRSSLSKYIKQIYRYGFHRGLFFFSGNSNSKKLIYVLPLIFTLFLILYFLINLQNINYILFLIFIYLSFLVIDLFFLIKYEKNIFILLFSRVLTLITPFIYVVGFAKSLLIGKIYKYKSSLKR